MQKRALDIFLIIVSLPLLLPILIITAISIRIGIGSPVLFRQPRAGLHGRTFTLLKFRSMTEDRNEKGELLPDPARLTKLGALLRRTSIDELPSLWNVFIGEMSLVGPRPLLIEYLPRYTTNQMRRHNVLPGITGWAQIAGRRTVVFSKRIALDTWYVDNQSIWLDLKILFLTLFRSSDTIHSSQDLRDVDDLGLHDATVAARAETYSDHMAA